MSDTDTAWWAVARRRRHPALDHIQTAYNRPQPAPELEPPVNDIGVMDQATYAANRDQLMNGIKPATEFRGVDMPTGRAAITREEMIALGMCYLNHDRPGPEPRPRGISTAGHTSIGGVPFRGAATTSTTTTTNGDHYA